MVNQSCKTGENLLRKVTAFLLIALIGLYSHAEESQSQECIAVFGGSFSCIEPSKVAKNAWTNAFGVKVLNFGKGGMGFVAGADTTNDIPNQVKRALAKGESYRAFILWASTNDIWSHTVQEQNEAIERCVCMIRAAQPESKILLFASMPIPLQQQANELLARFVEGQKETCRKLDVPCLDLYSESGITAENAHLYTGEDRFHPNEAGYAKVSDLQVEFLRRYVFSDNQQEKGNEEMNSIELVTIVAAMTGAALSAGADSSVNIGSVAQRWPWNNKVDITYTVDGGQVRANGLYCGLRFAVTANGQTYNIEGYSIGASAEDGTHTATWTAPKGIVSDACTISATLFTTNVPSGNDYMIVDLANGNVVYEGLYASQDLSNSRYSTDSAYKTDLLVLRKIPRTAESGDLPNGPFADGYPTGDSEHYTTSAGNTDLRNTDKKWTTDRAYYVGVFPVTQYQYQKIYGSNPSQNKTTIAGNTTEHRPVEYVSWDDLRFEGTSPTSSIPAVASADTGTFFQRLNCKTGLYFDLPTEGMLEIAERAGATTAYFWGNTSTVGSLADYAICSDNSGSSTVAVGSRLPNNWGLYDTAGNVWEWCRDGTVYGDLATRSDALMPARGNAYRQLHGGGYWDNPSTSTRFYASCRISDASSIHNNRYGFRVSLIAE